MRYDLAESLVRDERRRQDEKWGTDRHLDACLWLAILAEEFGEVANAVLERDQRAVLAELVQVAAVAVAWIESEDWKRP